MAEGSRPARAAVLEFTTSMAWLPLPAEAQAQGLTAERFHQHCHDRASAEWEQIGQWFCPASIRELIDGGRIVAARVTGLPETYRNAMPFCEPPGTTADAAIGVVVRFIEAVPTSLPLSAEAVVYEAFGTAWPCKAER